MAFDPFDLSGKFRKLDPNSDRMYVDFLNSPDMGARPRETSSASNSPRLQHRVPLFIDEDYPKSKGLSHSQSNDFDTKTKPVVRHIPIQIEGADNSSNRHRTYSGPAGCASQESSPKLNDRPFPSFKHPLDEISPASENKSQNKKPQVYNVPIQIEGRKSTSNAKKPFTKAKSPKLNGCNTSKLASRTVGKPEEKKVASSPKKEEQKVTPETISYNKINSVLEKMKKYKAEVDEFNGTMKDKQYRYLDEMLTRCMLDLDDVDTLGNEKIRSARKAAVKEVQSCIDLLELKVQRSNEQSEVKEDEIQQDLKDESQQIVETKDNENVLQHEIPSCGESDVKENLTKEMDIDISTSVSSEAKNLKVGKNVNESLKEMELDSQEHLDSVKAIEKKGDDQIPDKDVDKMDVATSEIEDKESSRVSQIVSEPTEMDVDNQESSQEITNQNCLAANIPIENSSEASEFVSTETTKEMDIDNQEISTLTEKSSKKIDNELSEPPTKKINHVEVSTDTSKEMDIDNQDISRTSENSSEKVCEDVSEPSTKIAVVNNVENPETSETTDVIATTSDPNIPDDSSKTELHVVARENENASSQNEKTDQEINSTSAKDIVVISNGSSSEQVVSHKISECVNNLDASNSTSEQTNEDKNAPSSCPQVNV